MPGFKTYNKTIVIKDAVGLFSIQSSKSREQDRETRNRSTLIRTTDFQQRY